MKLFNIELHEDEKIVLKIRQHWILHIWPALKFSVLAAFGFTGAYFLRERLDGLVVFLLLLSWLLLAFNFWFRYFLDWYLNMYIVTNKRIVNITHTGIFNRQATETSLNRVQDVTHATLGFMSMLFNYGDVVVQTGGRTTLIHFHKVPKPRKIHKIITSLVASAHFQHPMDEDIKDRPRIEI